MWRGDLCLNCGPWDLVSDEPDGVSGQTQFGKIRQTLNICIKRLTLPHYGCNAAPFGDLFLKCLLNSAQLMFCSTFLRRFYFEPDSESLCFLLLFVVWWPTFPRGALNVLSLSWGEFKQQLYFLFVGFLFDLIGILVHSLPTQTVLHSAVLNNKHI